MRTGYRLRIGYRWYISLGYVGVYEPEETTYPTLEATLRSIQEHNYPLAVCGINLVEDDGKSIEIKESLLTPTQRYFED